MKMRKDDERRQVLDPMARYLFRRSRIVSTLLFLIAIGVVQYTLLVANTVQKHQSNDESSENVEILRPSRRRGRAQKKKMRKRNKNRALLPGTKYASGKETMQNMSAGRTFRMASNDTPTVPVVKQEAPTHVPVLTAFIEQINFDEWDIFPLPNRSLAAKSRLKKVTYPLLNSCRNLPAQWPVDEPPTDLDPFLPWIHDVFPTHDGKYVQFVAQNKRRCQTGTNDTKVLMFMQPQVALFQNAPVKRTHVNGEASRYRLASYEEADEDSYMARFICRFKPSMVETLSEFNFDSDWASYRKRYKGFDKNHGNNNNQLHTSQLIFRCPVPPELQAVVMSGESVSNDWASLFVDLIPIRTPPRYGMPHQFFQPKYKTFETTNENDLFNATLAYGDKHILPRIEDSGRLENIPICKPSWMTYGKKSGEIEKEGSPSDAPKHRLVSCLWTSVGYTTRGDRFRVNDGERRLREWITYNKLVGYDHVYLYDNSAAQHSSATLKRVADLFPEDVTYINWPSKICNNNEAKHESPGERSSQYAAESSCRLRFGPHTDWVGQFDIDEYFIPMGNVTSAAGLMDKLDHEGVKAVNFQSQRAKVRRDFMNEIKPFRNKTICRSPAPCFHLSVLDNTTMLQAYNCDVALPGQKKDVDPAEKQFYRPDYVLQHFVHYSTVTTLLDKNQSEFEAEGFQWNRRGKDPRIRYADESNEGLMLHAKTISTAETSAYHRQCHIDNMKLRPARRGSCHLGLPWPRNDEHNVTNAEGLMYNCHVNDRIEHELVPRLVSALSLVEII